MLYGLDLLGVFAFGLSGSYFGLVKKLDLFGIFICALLTGLGGGTLREMMLGHIPIYLTDPHYIIAAACGMGAALLLYKQWTKAFSYFLIIDALGLATFAFIGAERADTLGLSAIAIVFFAVITAVGGGIMRDIALREIPYIFQNDFYATPALLLGILYVFLQDRVSPVTLTYGLILFIFLVRIVAIRFRLKVWAPFKS